MPWQLTDPVLIAAHIIVALQQIVSRHANPAIPSVLSFGKVEALGATNIIPSEVRMAGTFRTMNEDWRREAHDKITRMSKSIATGMGGECEVDIMHAHLPRRRHLRDHRFGRQVFVSPAFSEVYGR